MSLTTQEVKSMDFIRTGNKSISNHSTKQTAVKIASQLSTRSILWLLVKRHKVLILATGNIILVLNWTIPAWPEIIKSML